MKGINYPHQIPMTDLFIDYKKQNRSKKTFTIVTASLVLAVSVNAFLFKTDSGVRLQTSVINSGSKPAVAQKADVEIINAGTGTDMLKLRANSEMKDVSAIDFSLAFDPETLEISNVFSENKDMEISTTSNVPGMSHVFILIKTPTNIS